MSLQEIGERDVVIRSAPVKEHHPARRLLPSRRRCETFKRRIRGANVFVTIGYFEDGTPAEIFLSIAKTGAATRTLLSAFAQAVSVALQCGTPVSELDTSLQNLQEPTEQGSDPCLVIAFVFDCLSGRYEEEVAA